MPSERVVPESRFAEQLFESSWLLLIVLSGS
jgi:hypothetical protein